MVHFLAQKVQTCTEPTYVIKGIDGKVLEVATMKYKQRQFHTIKGSSIFQVMLLKNHQVIFGSKKVYHAVKLGN